MKKILITIILTVFFVNIAYANYQPTNEDASILAHVEAKITTISLSKLETIQARLSDFLKNETESGSRLEYVITAIYNIVINYVNKETEETMNALSLPDLYIEDLWIEDRTDYGGGRGIFAKFCNKGGVNLVNDGQYIESEYMFYIKGLLDTARRTGLGFGKPMLNGECKEVGISAGALEMGIGKNGLEEGISTVVFTIDSNKGIKESNEGNNSERIEVYLRDDN